MNRLLRTRTARYAPEAPKLKPFYGLILETKIEANFRAFVRRLKSDSKGNVQGMSKLLDLSSVHVGFISVSVQFSTVAV